MRSILRLGIAAAMACLIVIQPRMLLAADGRPGFLHDGRVGLEAARPGDDHTDVDADHEEAPGADTTDRKAETETTTEDVDQAAQSRDLTKDPPGELKDPSALSEEAAGERSADDGETAVDTGYREGRGKNHLAPDANAEGDHTVFRRGGDGEITNYATYEANHKNPSGFQETKRVDLAGQPHYDKAARRYIPTPHVKEAGEKGVRPADPSEIPK